MRPLPQPLRYPDGFDQDPADERCQDACCVSRRPPPARPVRATREEAAAFVAHLAEHGDHVSGDCPVCERYAGGGR